MGGEAHAGVAVAHIGDRLDGALQHLAAGRGDAGAHENAIARAVPRALDADLVAAGRNGQRFAALDADEVARRLALREHRGEGLGEGEADARARRVVVDRVAGHAKAVARDERVQPAGRAFVLARGQAGAIGADGERPVARQFQRFAQKREPFGAGGRVLGRDGGVDRGALAQRLGPAALVIAVGPMGEGGAGKRDPGLGIARVPPQRLAGERAALGIGETLLSPRQERGVGEIAEGAVAPLARDLEAQPARLVPQALGKHVEGGEARLERGLVDGPALDDAGGDGARGRAQLADALLEEAPFGARVVGQCRTARIGEAGGLAVLARDLAQRLVIAAEIVGPLADKELPVGRLRPRGIHQCQGRGHEDRRRKGANQTDGTGREVDSAHRTGSFTQGIGVYAGSRRAQTGVADGQDGSSTVEVISCPDKVSSQTGAASTIAVGIGITLA